MRSCEPLSSDNPRRAPAEDVDMKIRKDLATSPAAPSSARTGAIADGGQRARALASGLARTAITGLALAGLALGSGVLLTGCDLDTPTPDQPDECNGTWSNGRCYEGI
jgi:hypothetical protein